MKNTIIKSDSFDKLGDAVDFVYDIWNPETKQLVVRFNLTTRKYDVEIVDVVDVTPEQTPAQ